jgi:hypothetical protein
MNIDSKLFKKSLDLKKNKIIGCRADKTEREGRSYRYEGNCTIITITKSDDDGGNEASVIIEDCK